MAFYVEDANSRRKFLIDTGAMLSIIPPGPDRKNVIPTAAVSLVNADGSPLRCFGHQTLQISLLGRSYEWSFIVADVRKPLLGADFLAHHGLLVDVAEKRLLDVKSLQSLPLSSGPAMPWICNVTPTRYGALLKEFPEVFKPELRQKAGTPAKHGIYHHIKTSGPPTHAKFRRLPPAKLQDAKQAFADMEKMGICTKAPSPWASPLHMVKKPDGSWRPCGDYRRLNLVTEADHYPLPNMQDLTAALHGARIFTKMDLLKSYFQVPVHPEDIPKTAIITPFGSYAFAYSTFGLRNAGATFQRLMDGILGDLPFVSCYVDDILVYSRSTEEHMKHVKVVLQRLRENGLVVRFDKCIFGAEKVDFLGHEISSSGVRPMASKVEAIKKFPTPTSVKGLQEYIGMVNYYHRFIPAIATKMSSLYEVLKGKPKKLLWGPDQQQAFDTTKAALVEAATLSFQDPEAPLRLTTDASNIACGAVLEQVINGSPRPLAFYSKKLKPAETRYSTFDRELLAIHLAVRHFRYILEGSPFTIWTDHQPLIHAFTKSGDAWSARQQRHLSAIAEFGCTLQYIPGKKNPVADALSRVEIDNVQLGVNYEDLAEQQQLDPETSNYRTSITSLQWKDVPLGPNGTTLLCDVSTGRPRPLVPASRRQAIFQIIHGLSHPSGRATAKLMTQKFVWHGINKDVRAWTLKCVSCQTSKVARHTESGTGTIPQPKRRFGHIHVDVVGPLPPSGGAKYLLTIIDRSTRWLEATPMVEATTNACAEALLSSWVSRFGVPDDLTTDRGPSFLSEIWAALAELMGTKLHSTTAYNPAANGMVERSHRSIKAALMARCTDYRWKDHLPWILLGLRTAPKSDSGLSPAEMVYGEALAVPGEFFPSDTTNSAIDLPRLREAANRFRPCIRTYSERKKPFTPKGLDSCPHVFVRNDAHRTPLTRPYRGPYKVVDRNNKAFLLDIHGRNDWVSIDRLKPAFLIEDDVTVEPGRMPRLPPQNRPAPPARRFPGRGRPKKPQNIEDDKAAIDSTPEVPTLVSRRRGNLQRPKRYQN